MQYIGQELCFLGAADHAAEVKEASMTHTKLEDICRQESTDKRATAERIATGPPRGRMRTISLWTEARKSNAGADDGRRERSNIYIYIYIYINTYIYIYGCGSETYLSFTPGKFGYASYVSSYV